MQNIWVKICGLTTLKDAAAISALDDGPDAVGLNFYSMSKRFVTPEQACDLRAELGDSIDVFGVFVNERLENMAEIADRVGLSGVQFHGDESDERVISFSRQHPHLKIIRAYRIAGSDFTAATHSLQVLTAQTENLFAAIIDAFDPNEYGGTGHRINVDAVRDWIQQTEALPPIVLAGGLTPDNVADAVSAAKTMGADTASGVESSPGNKEIDLCKSFCVAARNASS